jgi:uracil-DNA glycosylase
VVFILWGSNARSKKQLITNKKHLILEAPHPSPLSAYNGFFGCRHFSLANKFLEKNGITPINWGAINNA